MLRLLVLGLIAGSAFVNAGPCTAPNVGNGKLIVVENGREVSAGEIIRDRKDVKIECDAGNIVTVGAGSSYCANGELQPALGECKPGAAPTDPPAVHTSPGLTCYVPVLAHGRYRSPDGLQYDTDTEIPSGSIIVAQCDAGYQISDVPLATRRCGRGGYFITPEPMCRGAADETTVAIASNVPGINYGSYLTAVISAVIFAFVY